MGALSVFLIGSSEYVFKFGAIILVLSLLLMLGFGAYGLFSSFLFDPNAPVSVKSALEGAQPTWRAGMFVFGLICICVSALLGGVGVALKKTLTKKKPRLQVSRAALAALLTTLSVASFTSQASSDFHLTAPETIGSLDMLIPYQGLILQADGVVAVQYLTESRNEDFGGDTTAVCSIYSVEPMISSTSYGVVAQIVNCNQDGMEQRLQVLYGRAFSDFGDDDLVERLSHFAD